MSQVVLNANWRVTQSIDGKTEAEHICRDLCQAVKASWTLTLWWYDNRVGQSDWCAVVINITPPNGNRHRARERPTESKWPLQHHLEMGMKRTCITSRMHYETTRRHSSNPLKKVYPPHPPPHPRTASVIQSDWNGAGYLCRRLCALQGRFWFVRHHVMVLWLSLYYKLKRYCIY